MSGKAKDTLLSDKISDFRNMILEILRKFEGDKEELERLDGIQQDYLHILEFCQLTREERAKVARDLADVRKKRRKVKNDISVETPIIEYFKSGSVGGKFLNELGCVVGNVRKAEKASDVRLYGTRVLSDDEDTYIGKIIKNSDEIIGKAGNNHESNIS